MTRKTLAHIRASRIEQFLAALANLKKGDEYSAVRFAERFEDMLADLPSPTQWAQMFTPRFTQLTYDQAMLEHLRDDVKQQDKPVDNALELQRLTYLSSFVQSLWNEREPQEKKFKVLGLHQLLSRHWDSTFLLASGLSGTGTHGPFAQVLLHLLESTERTLVCPNPNCPARFFFRKKNRQRYCSPECAAVGQLEAKRKWWRTTGEKQRKAQQKKYRMPGRSGPTGEKGKT
jgi:hypothetical protein